VAGVGIWVARRTAPDMAEAWNLSITPDAPPAATPDKPEQRSA